MDSSNPAESAKKKKRPRRRTVADTIPRPSVEQEKEMSASAKLLAALEKAQKGSHQKPSEEAQKKTSQQHESQTQKQKKNAHETPRTRLCSTSALPDAIPSSSRSNGGRKIPQDVLDSLHLRFITNIPDDLKHDNMRLCFQIELAHWFYVDFYCNQEERKDCPNMNMRDFTRVLLANSSELRHLSRSVDEIIEEWRSYKSNVPTYGAILLDTSLNNALLVQGYFASKNSWGFPKGKVNESEDPRDCAVREVLEETGFDFSLHSPHANEKRLQKFINETMVRLYVVTDVPMDFPFAPQTRNEIRKIQWFDVWALPTDRNDTRVNSNNFYTVVPFVSELQSYIKKEQGKRLQQQFKKKPKPATESFITFDPAPLPDSTFTKSEQQLPPNISSLFNHLMAEDTKPPKQQMKNKTMDPSVLSQQALAELAFGSAMNTGSSPFKPLSSEAYFSSGNIQNPPALAYPIPIVPEHAAVPPSVQAVTSGSGMKEKSGSLNRISVSETSAFTVIPSNRSTDSSLSKKIEAERDNHPRGNIIKFASERRSSYSISTNIAPDLAVPFESAHIKPCEAWENFKLDVNAVFNGLPGFAHFLQ